MQPPPACGVELKILEKYLLMVGGGVRNFNFGVVVVVVVGVILLVERGRGRGGVGGEGAHWILKENLKLQNGIISQYKKHFQNN